MSKIARRDLAQMFMFGFEGTELPGDMFDWLRDGLGGIILFARNIEAPEQLAKLTDSIQHAATKGKAELPALIGTDQEGGRVFRLKEPFTLFPPARNVGRAISQQGLTELASESAKAMALELAAMGIRLNFAPVLDVDSNPKNPIIGDRAFASEPDLVVKSARAILEGFRAAGVIACGKHFPGHGDTAQDSHLELPFVNAPLERLQSMELKPFEELIRSGDLEMIMTAHVLYPALDSEWPATMSSKILQDLLRFRMHYTGLIISDDLEMKAIRGRYDWREVVYRAVHAGVDIFLVCKSRDIQEKVFQAMEDLIDMRDISIERIRESLKRIKELKKKYLKEPRPFPQADWQAVVGCESHRKLAGQLSQFA